MTKIIFGSHLKVPEELTENTFFKVILVQKMSTNQRLAPECSDRTVAVLVIPSK